MGAFLNLVVGVLHMLEEAELSEHFTVVGTHALSAYETAASVRIVKGALATRDVDLLFRCPRPWAAAFSACARHGPLQPREHLAHLAVT